jgi:hypothetical protein
MPNSYELQLLYIDNNQFSHFFYFGEVDALMVSERIS